MKRNTLIITTVSALALIGLTTMAMADDDRNDDRRGWCQKGGPNGKMMRGHHGGGMGFGMMGGPRFMKDGKYDLKLTPERVKEIMEGRLAWRGNDNLKVGEVTTDQDGNIIAQLVTKDNSLVETFKVDPKTGAQTPLR
jgi:hypothetical protein